MWCLIWNRSLERRSGVEVFPVVTVYHLPIWQRSKHYINACILIEPEIDTKHFPVNVSQNGIYTCSNCALFYFFDCAKRYALVVPHEAGGQINMEITDTYDLSRLSVSLFAHDFTT